MLKISAVSYLNTKPFIYGLFRGSLEGQFELNLDIPSVCAQKLVSGEADLVLTPVAVIPEIRQAHLVSDFCIGATGKVRTVCLFSEVPLSEIKRILLDFHSRTSVALVRILCAEYWQIAPDFVEALPGFEGDIGGETAAVVIGDRAFPYHEKYPYVYDLGEAWTQWTGLPFVFAAWLSRKELPPEFLEKFNTALAEGIHHIPELVKILPSLPSVDLEEYFEKNISYTLDAEKVRGLNLFLEKLSGGGIFDLRLPNVGAATI